MKYLFKNINSWRSVLGILKHLFLSSVFVMTISKGNAVINGKNATYASSGIIAIGTSEHTVCTASKISDDIIITAAHCVLGKEVVVFSNKISNQEFDFARISVKEVVIHPSFEEITDFTDEEALFNAIDIALVKVNKTDFFEELDIIELNFDPILLPETDVQFIGYGCQDNLKDLENYFPEKKISNSENLLNIGIIRDHNFGIQQEFYQKMSTKIDSNYLMTSGVRLNASSSSLCFGDSGGPLISKNKIIGINANYLFDDMYEGYSDSGIPTVNLHQKISNVADWIKKTLVNLNNL